MRQSALLVLVAMAGLILTVRLRADSGTVRVSQRVAGHQITVFTEPTPLVAGTADISVLILDATGRPLTDVSVDVRAWPIDAPDLAVGGPATTATATNKLLQAIHLPLREPGPWTVEITANLTEGPAHVRFSMDVARPPPSWWELLPWMAWPAVPILLFVIHQLFSRTHPAAATSRQAASPEVPSRSQ
jgi:hypothetical protein